MPIDIEPGESFDFVLQCSVGSDDVQPQSVDFYLDANGQLVTKRLEYEIRLGEDSKTKRP